MREKSVTMPRAAYERRMKEIALEEYEYCRKDLLYFASNYC